MKSVTGPRLIGELGRLPDYPSELLDAQLSADYFTMFWHDRWLNSELHLTAPLDVQAAALNLIFYSRKQTPVGSLPNSDQVLARLLRLELSTWLEMRQRNVNPLHNWELYRTPDGVVLGHEVVIEVCMHAATRRQARELRSSAAAQAKRVWRLGKSLRDKKVSSTITEDDVLMGRLDEWLVENFRGRRGGPQFEAAISRALEHAYQVGWIA